MLAGRARFAAQTELACFHHTGRLAARWWPGQHDLQNLVLDLQVPLVAFGFQVAELGTMESVDLAIEVHSDDTRTEQTEPRPVRLSVTKPGQGSVGDVKLVFWTKQMRFEEKNELV